MKRMGAFVMAGLFMFVLSGCGEQSSKEIAMINGEPVTQEEFDAYLTFKRIPAKNDKRVAHYLDQYLEREALASVIAEQDLLNNQLIQAELDDFRRQMLISRYFEKFLKENVTPQAVRNYYNTHADEYKARKAHVAHILIRTNRKMSEPERKAKLTTAQEIYSKAISGQAFDKLAKTYSEDRISGKKGGDLGWLKEGSIAPRFSKKAFEMTPGDIAQPVETQFGFHVIKLLEGPKIVKQPFKAVSGDIRYRLRAKAKRAEIERLKSLAEIEKKVKEK